MPTEKPADLYHKAQGALVKRPRGRGRKVGRLNALILGLALGLLLYRLLIG